jgi:hypothetical protein
MSLAGRFLRLCVITLVAGCRSAPARTAQAFRKEFPFDFVRASSRSRVATNGVDGVPKALTLT